MYFNIIWLYRYRRFKKKYGQKVNDCYHDYGYFKHLVIFSEMLKAPRINETVKANKGSIITTHFDNLEVWLETTQKSLKQLTGERFIQQPIYPIRQVVLEDFLTTNDGKRIVPYSALKEVEAMLDLLYNAMMRYREQERSFYIKQYKECFVTGLVFYRFLIELYLSQ